MRQETKDIFSNPSENEVPACEGRDPLGSKITAVRRAELSKRNYPVEELYPTNYPTGKIIQEELSGGKMISNKLSDRQNYPRGIIWWKNYILGIIRQAELSKRNYPKITTNQVFGVSSFRHLLPYNDRSSLEKKRDDENVCER